jgi:methyl-accepting chemotaxis protein
MTIKNRLIIAFLAILLIPSVAIGYFSYTRAANEVTFQMQDSSQQNIDTLNASLSKLVTSNFADTDWLAKQIKGTDDPARIQYILDSYKAVHAEVESVYYASKDGAFIISPNKKMDAGFDPRQRPWYANSIAKPGKALLNDPIVSADGKGTLSTIISKNADDNSGVVGSSLDLTMLTATIKGTKIGQTGYVFLLDKDRKYIAHPTAKLMEVNTQAHVDGFYKADKGAFDYTLNGTPKKAIFVTNSDTQWKIIGSMEMAEVTAATKGILYTTVIVVAISLVLGAILALWIIRSINNPLNRLIEATDRIANGDLKEEVKVTSKDELATLSESVNNMVRKLRELIGGVVVTSQNVAAASEEISATTQEIASGSTVQAESAQHMQELFSELQVAISAVAQSAEDAAELASNTTEIARQGGEIVNSSLDSMNEVSAQVSLLEDDSNKIGDIIEVISDIAEQTNLLALNAAIEAARAGDQGRGFAVVADEVRKLAERSSDASKQITTIIKGMQANTQKSVVAVTNGVTQSQETGKAFDKIVEMINKTESRVTEIAAACEEQSAQTAEVMNSIENISAASQSAAAASEETAATSQSLAQLAEELNQSVSIFKVN